MDNDKGLIEVRRQVFGKDLWGQDLAIAFIQAQDIPDRASCPVPGLAIDPNFEGMGVTLSNKSGGIALSFTNPDLPIPQDLLDTLTSNGIPPRGAFNMVAVSQYNDLAIEVAKAFFKNPGQIDPTVKLTTGDDEHGKQQVKQVYIMMKGTPNNSPSWHINGYNAG